MSEWRLPRSTPASAGVDPAGILAFVEGMESKGLGPHSFMVVRHGSVVAEGWWKPYRRDDIHLLYSLSKSFTSTAVGFAVSEGRFGLDDTVVSFFPDDLPETISENLAAMRVRDLLAMATGHETEPSGLRGEVREGDTWVRGFLRHPVVHEPGTHFLYNSIATYMCSAILQKTTGEKLVDYLRPRLFEPLGIGNVTSDSCPAGINVGGWGMSVTTETIAKFGQLYLQKGMWNGEQLLPGGWVELATQSHISNGTDPNNDWNQGYGFQFWRCRHNCYRGDGAFGQNCIVIPDLDTVVVTTASNPDLGATLQLVWDHVLPAMRAVSPIDSADLQSKLDVLEIAVDGDADLAEFPVGDFADEKHRLIVTRDGDGVRVQFDFGYGLQEIYATSASWTDGNAVIQWSTARVASRVSLVGNGDLQVRIVDLNGPFHLTIFVRPTDGGVDVDIRRFGDFGENELPTISMKRV